MDAVNKKQTEHKLLNKLSETMVMCTLALSTLALSKFTKQRRAALQRNARRTGPPVALGNTVQPTVSARLASVVGQPAAIHFLKLPRIVVAGRVGGANSRSIPLHTRAGKCSGRSGAGPSGGTSGGSICMANAAL